jgi:hypothetical protein
VTPTDLATDGARHLAVVGEWWTTSTIQPWIQVHEMP